MGLILGMAAWAVSASAQTTGVVVLKGETGPPLTLTAADIASAPRAAVVLALEGKPVRFTGARLDALLAKVDAPLGKGLRGPALADVILAKAADGYRVALSLGDVDSAMRAEPVILADQADGRPLGADGPFRLVVGGDLRPARSARSVVEIDVLRLP